jgi:hypothetical protein
VSVPVELLGERARMLGGDRRRDEVRAVTLHPRAEDHGAAGDIAAKSRSATDDLVTAGGITRLRLRELAR